MALWFQAISLEEINQRGTNTMSEFLGIQFTEIGEDFLTATMPVTKR